MPFARMHFENTNVQIKSCIEPKIMQTQSTKFILSALLAVFVFVTHVPGNSQEDTLFKNFQNPPESARPRTWWHWTAGNVTLEGITKDLEWIQRVGIAGFQLADVRFGGPAFALLR